jgi:hypothetical protein
VAPLDELPYREEGKQGGSFVEIDGRGLKRLLGCMCMRFGSKKEAARKT